MPGDDRDNTENAPAYDDSKDACNPDNYNTDNFDEGDIIIKA